MQHGVWVFRAPSLEVELQCEFIVTEYQNITIPHINSHLHILP